MFPDYAALYAQMMGAAVGSSMGGLGGEIPEELRELLRRQQLQSDREAAEDIFNEHAPTPAALMRQRLESIALKMSKSGVRGKRFKGKRGGQVEVFRIEFSRGGQTWTSDWAYTERAAFTDAALKWEAAAG